MIRMLLAFLTLPISSVLGSYWFKTYSLSPYKQYWTLNLEVRRLDKSLPEVLKAFSQAEASLVVPLNNLVGSRTPPSQQLRYRLSLPAAQRVYKKLKKLGLVSQPQIQPELNSPPLAEVREKLAKLQAAKNAHGAELELMPEVASLVDEVIEHLSMVGRIQGEEDSEVLLNMTVLEAASRP